MTLLLAKIDDYAEKAHNQDSFLDQRSFHPTPVHGQDRPAHSCNRPGLGGAVQALQ
jgi:hypothetical protein